MKSENAFLLFGHSPKKSIKKLKKSHACACAYAYVGIYYHRIEINNFFYPR